MKELFEKLKKENRAALVVFISCGDPDMDFTRKLVKSVCEAGADIVELGVPFSDPMADGPAIQAAGRRALDGGANILRVLDMAAELRHEGVGNPFVLFSYFNPIFKLGVENMAKRSAKCGINGWLVVDLPLEESAEASVAAKSEGIDFIPLAAPTTPLDRLEAISESGDGFLYYVTVAGVTGARKSLPAHFAERLADVRKASKLPVAAGFGISTPEMAAEAAKSADAVVVGSKLVTLAHDTLCAKGRNAAIEESAKFVASLAAAMKRS